MIASGSLLRTGDAHHSLALGSCEAQRWARPSTGIAGLHLPDVVSHVGPVGEPDDHSGRYLHKPCEDGHARTITAVAIDPGQSAVAGGHRTIITGDRDHDQQAMARRRGALPAVGHRRRGLWPRRQAAARAGRPGHRLCAENARSPISPRTRSSRTSAGPPRNDRGPPLASIRCSAATNRPNRTAASARSTPGAPATFWPSSHRHTSHGNGNPSPGTP